MTLCAYDKLQKGWVFRADTWNVDALTGRAGEVVKVLGDRRVSVSCVQKTRGIGSCCSKGMG